jgi:hypothetical protein
MNDWMKQRDLLVEEALAFAQAVAARAPKTALTPVHQPDAAQVVASVNAGTGRCNRYAKHGTYSDPAAGRQLQSTSAKIRAGTGRLFPEDDGHGPRQRMGAAKPRQAVENRFQIETPAGTADRRKHVDEERRTPGSSKAMRVDKDEGTQSFKTIS